MEIGKQSLIQYFNYDLEKLLNEFNNYYILKSPKLPTHIQSLYLYFSHLAENSLQLLMDIKYNYNHALDIVNVPSIYIKPYSNEEINQYLKKYQHNPRLFYGLVSYPLYFFEKHLNYIKYNDGNGILSICRNIPIIEKNLSLIGRLV